MQGCIFFILSKGTGVWESLYYFRKIGQYLRKKAVVI